MYKKITLRNKNVQSQNKNIEMNPIEESIVSYLQLPSSGALLITGDWGCGKTYYLKNKLFTSNFNVAYKKDKSYVPIIVSLFGISNLKEIPERVLSAYLDKVGSNSRTTSL